jgi:hypothetical protein
MGCRQLTVFPLPRGRGGNLEANICPAARCLPQEPGIDLNGAFTLKTSIAAACEVGTSIDGSGRWVVVGGFDHYLPTTNH